MPVPLEASDALAILKAEGLRAETSISDEMREHLDCEQLGLESGFVEAKPYPYQVLVRTVNLDPIGALEEARSVVKFSKRGHALTRSDALKLATAAHYRKYEGDGVGIRDTDEGVYEESLQSHLGKWNPEALDSFWWGAVTSGSVTYKPDSDWLFCTSFPPKSRRERMALEREFQADCVTALGEPAVFARELGSAVAQMTLPPKVSLEEWFHKKQRQMMLVETPFKQLVWVTHGPVVYTDDAEPLIESVPLLQRSAAVPFVEGLGYAHQREYRFTVSIIGKPNQETLLVPDTPELRRLASGVG